MPRCSSSRPATPARCSTRPSWRRAIPRPVSCTAATTPTPRALVEGIFEAYDSPALESVPDELRLDPENRALPIDYGDVCLNYDKAYFAERRLRAPPPPRDPAPARAHGRA